MKKKLLSIVLAGTMAASVVAAGAVAVSADEDKAPGGYGVLGEYTPSSPDIKTNRLLFAMPGAWQNDTTKNEKCGGVAGIYWWSGFDTPDAKVGHGWPGYKTVKVAEEGVENLFEINVPTLGNGEAGNATMIIWNNYLDGGTETDDAKNPFYKASQQTRDFAGQYYSRTDLHDTYDYLFRYIYKYLFEKENIEGVAALDLKSDTFWVDINRLAAASLGRDFDKLGADEKTYQVDEVLDNLDFDLSAVFGSYTDNFFNEDLVEAPDESQGFGMSFSFNNMVFVVNFDPAKMKVSPASGKIGFDGDVYFYYGGGEYGSWPTKELNEEMKQTLGAEFAISGNIMSDEYYKSSIEDISIPTVATDPTSATPTATTIPAASTDAGSSTKDTASGSTTANSSNGAIATGQVSLVAILLVVIAAGVGVAVFTRKKSRR